MPSSDAGEAMACRRRNLPPPRWLVFSFSASSKHFQAFFFAAYEFNHICFEALPCGKALLGSSADSHRSISLYGKNPPHFLRTDLEPSLGLFHSLGRLFLPESLAVSLLFTDAKTSLVLHQPSAFHHSSDLVKPSFPSTSHHHSWPARSLPPVVHQVYLPLLCFELSEILWRRETLGPTVAALSRRQAAMGNDLIWSESPSSGPGPRLQELHLSPLPHHLKTSPHRFNSIPPKPVCIKPITQVQTPSEPMSVFTKILSTLISWMPLIFALAGRRIHRSRVAALSLIWVDSYLCRTLMARICGGSSESLCLRKPYTICTLTPIESIHQASLAAGEIPGPLHALCLMSLSRAHGIYFFWVKLFLTEELFSFSKTKFAPSIPSLLGDASQPSRTLLEKSLWYALSTLFASLYNPDPCCLYLNGRRLHSIAAISVYWLCYSLWLFKQPYSLMEIPYPQSFTSFGKQTPPAASSMEQPIESSYASKARASYDHDGNSRRLSSALNP